MVDGNKIFIAIILGAMIIGGFVYMAILQKSPLAQNDSKNVYSAAIESSVGQISECQAAENTIITKVIDGDTVVAEGGYHLRLLGIDADEKGYPCYESAKNRLEELVLRKQVILKKDITDVDQYKRCLRAIFIGDQNIGLELVREGLAIARFYEPDLKYKNEIQDAEKQAIKNKAGCKWSIRPLTQ